MLRAILRHGADVLHRPAAPVETITADIQQLVDDMIQTMYAAPGVGLAATQIGVPLRIFVADITVGRTAGQVEGFNYTANMKKLGVTWSAETLATYLAGPAKMVPGTKMTFPGFSEPKQTADVIAYLATLR